MTQPESARSCFVNQQSAALTPPDNHTSTAYFLLIGPEAVGAKRIAVVFCVAENGKGELPQNHPNIEQVCNLPETRAHAEVDG